MSEKRKPAKTEKLPMDMAWNIPVDQPLHDRLRLAAFEDRKSAAEIIRRAVREWLDRRDQGVTS
jgi:hypothetical protein